MTLDNNLSLGQYLRQARESRGITIEQVASATKVGVRQLHALESDHYSELPAKPFIRGFVISYSRFIGIDHKEVLARYGGFLEEKVQERPNRESGHSGYVFEKRDGEQQSRTVLGIVMGSFVVLGGLVMVFLKPSLHHHHGSQLDKLRAMHPATGPSSSVSGGGIGLAALPSAGPSEQPVPASSVAGPMVAASPAASVTPIALSTPNASGSPSVKEASLAISTPLPSGTALPAPTTEADPADPLNSGKKLKPSETKHRVVVKGEEAVWVRYRVDDKPIMQFVLKKGGVLVLRAKDLIVFQVAHPENVQISHNGEGYHSMKGDGSVAVRHDDATLFYPSQLIEKISDPFPGARSLSTRPAPTLRAAAPMPTPSP